MNKFNEYSIAEVAKLLNVHKNTVIKYEKWGYIKEVKRKENGYRVFTEDDVKQLYLVRKALKLKYVKIEMKFWELDIIKKSADNDYKKALEVSNEYLNYIIEEEKQDLEIFKDIFKKLKKYKAKNDIVALKTNEVAKIVGVSNDTIICWERNGLLRVERNEVNNYRIFNESDLLLLQVIKILRDAKYITSAIIKLFDEIKLNNGSSLRECVYSLDFNVLNEDEINKFLEPLARAKENTKEIIKYIESIHYTPEF